MFGNNLEDKRFILRETSAIAIGITIGNKLAEFSEHNERIFVPCWFGYGMISFLCISLHRKVHMEKIVMAVVVKII